MTIKTLQKIENLSEEIRELLGNGFYPEDYHRFCSDIEAKLDELEELVNKEYRNSNK